MSDDLDPITPEAALAYYLDARRYDLRETTMRTHESRLRSFVDWLQDQGIQNMNEVDLRTVHAYRVSKREDNGDDDTCNDVTMQGQISTVRRFLSHIADLDGVPEDDHGREPLITTQFGRPSVTTLQNWVYRLTRPCVIGEPCPHDYDPDTCEYNTSDGASGCPSSVAPHAVRTGSITAHRDAGTPREVVSDRGDVSEKILEKHYDKASKRQRMRRRRDHLPDEI